MKKIVLGILLGTCIVFGVTACSASSNQESETMFDNKETDKGNSDEVVNAENNRYSDTEMLDETKNAEKNELEVHGMDGKKTDQNSPEVEVTSEDNGDSEYPYVTIEYVDRLNKPDLDEIFFALDAVGVPHDAVGTVSVGNEYFSEGVNANLYSVDFLGDNGAIAYASVMAGEKEVVSIYMYTEE